MVRGLGEFKKANPQARCCQKKKARGKKGTGYLGDVEKKKKGSLLRLPKAGGKFKWGTGT